MFLLVLLVLEKVFEELSFEELLDASSDKGLLLVEKLSWVCSFSDDVLEFVDDSDDVVSAFVACDEKLSPFVILFKRLSLSLQETTRGTMQSIIKTEKSFFISIFPYKSTS